MNRDLIRRLKNIEADAKFIRSQIEDVPSPQEGESVPASNRTRPREEPGPSQPDGVTLSYDPHGFSVGDEGADVSVYLSDEGADVSVYLDDNGLARCYIERADFEDPGTAHPAARAQVEKWKAKNAGFETIDGVLYYGPKNANEGNSAGVYGNMGWYVGSDIGLEMTLRQAVGYCNRMRMWNFDPDAWAEGRIEPAPLDDFLGFDKTREYEVVGLDFPPVRIPELHGRLDQVNSNHLGRVGWPLYWLAKHGNAFGKLALRVLADQVRLGWCVESPMARRLMEADDVKKRPAAYSYFTCHEILDRYPAGQGCHIMGRGFGHDLTILANAEEIWPGRYTKDLWLMAATLRHVWDEEHSCILAIPALDPIWGEPVSAYQKKLNVDQESIPPGEFPKIQRTFEEVIVRHGVGRLADVLVSGVGHILEGMTKALQMHKGSSSELRVIAHPEWSDPDTALGTLNLLGVPGDRWNKGKTAEELIPTMLPCQDHPLNSWDPSLWN